MMAIFNGRHLKKQKSAWREYWIWLSLSYGPWFPGNIYPFLSIINIMCTLETRANMTNLTISRIFRSKILLQIERRCYIPKTLHCIVPYHSAYPRDIPSYFHRQNSRTQSENFSEIKKVTLFAREFIRVIYLNSMGIVGNI